MYEYVVQARRVEETEWLPIACNTIEDAYAMIEYVMTEAGGKDLARLARRRGDSMIFEEIASYSRF